VIGDITWNTPGRSSADSLPLGNGDIAANVWTDKDGDILFYLSKTDAWDHLSRLIKIGRLRISVKPDLLDEGKFEQQLSLADASVIVTNGSTKVRLWMDAHWPRLMVEVTSKDPCDVRAELEPWRNQAREITGREAYSALGLDPKKPVTFQPDIIVPKLRNAVAWYQRNESSIWPEVLDQQSLGEFKSQSDDPLIGRTFGGHLHGEGFKRKGRNGITTVRKTTSAVFYVTVHCAQTPTVDEWVTQIQGAADPAGLPTVQDAWRDHQTWWREFWDRSYIHAGLRDTDWCNPGNITEHITWQRYMVACSGRGLFPIKFNGGLFTADWGMQGESYDADYRRWGGGYWWQNTRLLYWGLLANGDFDLMRPLFRMYRDMLPLAEHRTQVWFGHGGAFFAETQYFWGTHLPTNYGLNRTDKEPGDVENQYIRRYWQSGFELIALMLATYQHTGDEALLAKELLPVARAVLRFYSLHYPNDSEGRLLLKPAQSLETWWESENPMPEVAGLHYLLPQLLALPDTALEVGDLGAWRALSARLPRLPIGVRKGARMLLNAAVIEDTPHNSENPELYAVFPYKLYGIGHPDLEAARNAYTHRTFPDTGCWRQDAIHAAYLGITNAAAYLAHKNCEISNQPQIRFKGFWGPNYDWIPDFDHGGVTQITMQTMLVQCVGTRIYLFPAWPDERWNVEFKLHLPGQTTIECELKDGDIIRLEVTPPARRRDIVVLLGQDVSLAAELPATFPL
jgi:alpha-L-fucosidase 2